MITINELLEMCKRQVKKGNGNMGICISDDEEGNGFHGLYYGLEPIIEMDKENQSAYIDSCGEITKENYKTIAILG